MFLSSFGAEFSKKTGGSVTFQLS